MTIVELSNLFNTLTAMHPGLASYHFGWPSDRITNPAGNYDESQQGGATFPRLLWVPVEDGELNMVRMDDRLPITLIFDDLFGYDGQGQLDTATKAEKWQALRLAALQFMRLLRDAARAITPLPLGIVDDRVTWSLDMMPGHQRLISVVLRFNLYTKAQCEDLALSFPGDVPAGYAWPPSTTDDLENTLP